MEERIFGIRGSLHPGAAGAEAVGEAAQDAIPPTRAEREGILAAARRHVMGRTAIPPFSVKELEEHSAAVLAAAGADEKYRKFAAVLVSNEAWRPTVGAVPFARRLLLLPKCLRSEKDCRGMLDELGLVCAACGSCPIHEFKAEAERLGYAVLVAEGAAVVMALIQSRRIEAVVGVSCIQALESIYPLMESAAVPGIAIPLLCNGCANTRVEAEWVWDAIRLCGTDAPQRLDLDSLRRQVDGWFAADALEEVLGPAATETERLARGWLAKSGKRWRPLLAAAAYQALREDPQSPLPESLRRIALAVECFHKASLVHDDIEDDDATRYGEKTLHEEHGVPVALNVGDFLLGEGYRLIAESRWPAERKVQMLRAAASGHRELCLGQGAELCWARRPAVLSAAEVLAIFRRKTAPAFEVALRLGALAAGTADGCWDALHRYSEALGIAYQIGDDLKDYDGDGDPDDVAALRPSILLAIAHERAEGGARQRLESVWRRTAERGTEAPGVRRLLEELGIIQEARRLLGSYEDEAIRSLEPLCDEALKGLLRRVIFRIFSRLPAGPVAAGVPWPAGREGPGQGDLRREPEAGHAPGGPPRGGGAR
ncbi:MAG: DUF116 domain-containing protein [Planctomycetes bacterium]|nr:DUF116 domain-containing protein [Planctomycetota bacterium]